MNNTITNLLNNLNPFKSTDLNNTPLAKSQKPTANAKDDPAGFMVSIIQAQHSEYKKEIKHWLAGRDEALNTQRPRRRSMYELYDSMLSDAIILSEVGKRIDRILNKEFKIVDFSSKKENPDKTDLFNKAWFYDWMRYTIESILYGHSLPYVKQITDGLITEVDLIDRKHIVPEQHAFLPDLNGEKLIDYTQPPFSQYATPVGKPKNLGLLDAIAPLYILKKHSWASWDQFEEMFGIPIRTAKTASTDPKVQAAITSWLKTMGSTNFGMFPEAVELTIHESKQTDAFEVFNQKRKACNEEICTLLNSQSEANNQNGSRAKTESVMSNTQDETTKADLRFLYFQINDKLMPLLAGIGYNINPLQDVFQWNIPDDLEAKLTIFQGVANMGFEVDPVQVEETFNVKIIGKTEPTANSQQPPDKTGK